MGIVVILELGCRGMLDRDRLKAELTTENSSSVCADCCCFLLLDVGELTIQLNNALPFNIITFSLFMFDWTELSA